tara:strand:- start:1870 stop:2982 length:1113 start_codon:yes stop_codon:yes gene_type:complete
MADIKFSQFTAESNPAAVDFIVGYAGGNNVRISPSDLNSGGVTSVGLAMPAAFSVANSPITSAGTLTVTGAGAVTDYIDGTGALQTFPTIPTVPANIITGSVSSGQIPFGNGANTVNSSNEFTFNLTGGSSSSGPTIGIGLGGAANTKGAIEIDSFVDYDGSPFDYFLFTGSGGPFLNFAGTGLFAISVHAAGRFMGSGIHIFSDERIKKDIKVSDSKKDLEVLAKIEISDYKYIDPIKGDKEKKVIAQQVKKHYPIAVKQGTDVIPSILKQGEIKNGIIDLNIDCVVGDKIKLIYPNNQHEIVEVLDVNENSVTVDSIKNDKVVVYGKEVNDYQTVDYDALSMLNISAVQELYKMVKELKQEVKALKQV